MNENPNRPTILLYETRKREREIERGRDIRKGVE